MELIGTVRNGKTGKPIGRAAVSAPGDTAQQSETTDDNGRFKIHIQGIPIGEPIRIRVEKSGYKTSDIYYPLVEKFPIEISLARKTSSPHDHGTSENARDTSAGERLYAAEVGATILNPGQFWAVYRSGTGEAVAPVDALIGSIVIVNLQDRPTALSSVGLEIGDGNKWMELKRIPLNGVHLYMGPLKQAALATGTPGDLNLRLVNAEISPGESVRGMGIFEYQDKSFRATGAARQKIRVTITDTAKHRVLLTDTDPGQNKAGTDDPFGSTEQFALTLTGPPVDLSVLPMRRFLPADR